MAVGLFVPLGNGNATPEIVRTLGPEPLTALTYLAAVTDRIRLGTGICLVPQRNPVYTAKAVTDLDSLSGGRVEFGVGVGWLREEFEALACRSSGAASAPTSTWRS